MVFNVNFKAKRLLLRWSFVNFCSIILHVRYVSAHIHWKYRNSRHCFEYKFLISTKRRVTVLMFARSLFLSGIGPTTVWKAFPSEYQKKFSVIRFQFVGKAMPWREVCRVCTRVPARGRTVHKHNFNVGRIHDESAISARSSPRTIVGDSSRWNNFSIFSKYHQLTSIACIFPNIKLYFLSCSNNLTDRSL